MPNGGKDVEMREPSSFGASMLGSYLALLSQIENMQSQETNNSAPGLSIRGNFPHGSQRYKFKALHSCSLAMAHR